MRLHGAASGCSVRVARAPFGAGLVVPVQVLLRVAAVITARALWNWLAGACHCTEPLQGAAVRVSCLAGVLAPFKGVSAVELGCWRRLRDENGNVGP